MKFKDFEVGDQFVWESGSNRFFYKKLDDVLTKCVFWLEYNGKMEFNGDSYDAPEEQHWGDFDYRELTTEEKIWLDACHKAKKPVKKPYIPKVGDIAFCAPDYWIKVEKIETSKGGLGLGSFISGGSVSKGSWRFALKDLTEKPVPKHIMESFKQGKYIPEVKQLEPGKYYTCREFPCFKVSDCGTRVEERLLNYLDRNELSSLPGNIAIFQKLDYVEASHSQITELKRAMLKSPTKFQVTPEDYQKKSKLLELQVAGLKENYEAKLKTKDKVIEKLTKQPSIFTKFMKVLIG